MGTPPASGSLDQIRNVQRKARFGVAKLAIRNCDKSVERSTASTGIKQVIRAVTATSCWSTLLPLASGGFGKALFFSALAQQALFGQLPGLQLSPIGGLETGHADTGNWTALTKSAATMRTAGASRFIRPLDLYSTRHACERFDRNWRGALKVAQLSDGSVFTAGQSNRFGLTAQQRSRHTANH